MLFGVALVGLAGQRAEQDEAVADGPLVLLVRHAKLLVLVQGAAV